MILKALIFALFPIVGYYVYRLNLLMDPNKEIYNHRPGPCRTVSGIENGSEDIELDRKRNIAFISSGIFYLGPRTPGIKGEIFLYDYTDNKAQKLPISAGQLDMDTFAPHGLTSWEVNGELHLYAVSHPGLGLHTIEEFVYEEKPKRQLKHVKTIKDDLISRPNDLVAVGPGKFIITNDGSSQSMNGNAIEVFLELRAGSVVYYDGEKAHMLAAHLHSPNGIALDKSKKFLYVAGPHGKRLYVFAVKNNFKSATLINEIRLTTAPDNLFTDENGAVWTGAHPIFWKLMHYCSKPQDKKVLAPSQVLRFEFSPDHLTFKMTEPYADDGHQLAGSTVAVYHKKKLLIGTVHRTMLECDINDDSVL